MHLDVLLWKYCNICDFNCDISISPYSVLLCFFRILHLFFPIFRDIAPVQYIPTNCPALVLGNERRTDLHDNHLSKRVVTGLSLLSTLCGWLAMLSEELIWIIANLQEGLFMAPIQTIAHLTTGNWKLMKPVVTYCLARCCALTL